MDIETVTSSACKYNRLDDRERDARVVLAENAELLGLY